MKMPRILLAAALTLTASVHAGGFDACRDQFYQGFEPRQAQPAPKQRALCFDGFAVLHSGASKTPVYVAQHLTPERLDDARDEARTDRFYEEARLPRAERATLDDYRGSGLDRGHMAPAADMPTPSAMAQSFSLANMVPQAPENNRGAWAKSVERATRSYVDRGNEVYVFTGPIFGASPATVGPGRVWVPQELFKLVYDPAKRRAWAYIVPNTNDARVRGLHSYAELVGRTGIEFLPPGAVADPSVKR